MVASHLAGIKLVADGVPSECSQLASLDKNNALREIKLRLSYLQGISTTMSVIAHQTEKEWISANEKSRQRMSQTQLRAQQNNMQPDLRMHICEHIIRVLQYQKDVYKKLHICVKRDFVVSNHTITLNLHSGTTQWKILGSGSMFSFTQ
ncbi:hypothetical protein TNCV_3167751 [Trichonephila clavipes]|uniref:Uncharacterized protein n=1 Tax=Trichonephila clavipes TaxID=2585209 RepID=A0A8X6V2N7_TRICX|nr:hypothetical protein TNCV_3167751 [Trichonephila clavipes]